MSLTPDDVDARVRSERDRLLHILDRLDAEQWATPSLCAGWSVRDLVVHLLMPYEVSMPRFLAMMLRARFSFDRAADRWATTDPRSTSEVLSGLRETEHRAFAVPGAPVEAPLSHLVIHAEDVYRPLGVPSPTDPHNARIALEQLTTPRGTRARGWPRCAHSCLPLAGRNNFSVPEARRGTEYAQVTLR
jgi:uncharacterized protein (TIGR03083 family)